MQDFLKIKSKLELCNYLHITESEFNYLIYSSKLNNRYFSFNVEKRNGSFRKIHSPNKSLKDVQQIIKTDLLKIYGQKGCVHGFVKGKNIKTNAEQHLNKKFIVNTDLNDFFGSINFGRVRGLFLCSMFGFDEKIATLIAQVVCYQGFLPQGAPTSPIISNFICRKLDNDLLKFAKENRLHYTRYADDITFSTNSLKQLKSIGILDNGRYILSEKLRKVINDNGFEINENKTRLSTKLQRQSVTGLIINERANIERKYYRSLRSILHSCEKKGIEVAAKIHLKKIGIPQVKLSNPIEFFLKRIVGMTSFIGFVRGKKDPIYQKLYARVKLLIPNARLSIIYEKIDNASNPLILTEGKTDWKHIKAALQRFQADGKYTSLKCEFADYLDEHKISNSELLKICESLPKIGKHPYKIICVFDRDDRNFIPKVTSSQFIYKDWTNNIYSMVLPIPPHRDFESICIEHFYTDDEIKTYDENFRRLFISKEFNDDGLLNSHNNIYRFTQKKEKLLNRFPFIIDSGVTDENGLSVALSKNDFSEYILKKHPNFDNFDITAFSYLFDNIEVILNEDVK